jgi:hypothetical protein
VLRTLITTALGAGCVLGPSFSYADSPADAFAGSRVIITAERVSSLVTYDSLVTTNPTLPTLNGSAAITTSTMAVGVVTNGTGVPLYSTPRLTLDVVVAARITVGGSAWVWTTTK